MNKNSDFIASEIKIRPYEEKDIEFVINRHRDLYDMEYKFSSEFSDYVEVYVNKFNENHDKDKENMWIVECEGKSVGVIAIVKVDDFTAQLRWFLIEPKMRGHKLGHELMKTAINFCTEKGYNHVLLWTVDILETARHLYSKYRFTLTESVDNTTWTNNLLKEERWDVHL